MNLVQSSGINIRCDQGFGVTCDGKVLCKKSILMDSTLITEGKTFHNVCDCLDSGCLRRNVW